MWNMCEYVYNIIKFYLYMWWNWRKINEFWKYIDFVFVLNKVYLFIWFGYFYSFIGS